MPGSSHANCKVCGARTHRRHRFGMCKNCSDRHYARIQAERKATKARKAARAAAVALEEEQEPVSESKLDPKLVMAEAIESVVDTTRRRADYSAALSRLSDDTKLEIVGHYQDMRIPGRAIVETYGISNGALAALVDELGIPRRGTANAGKLMPGHFELHNGKQTWVIPEERPVDPQVQKALENMIKLPASEPPVIHSTRPEPSPAPVPLLTFIATVQGKVEVGADDMVQAIELIRRRFPDLRITRIEEPPAG